MGHAEQELLCRGELQAMGRPQWERVILQNFCLGTNNTWWTFLILHGCWGVLARVYSILANETTWGVYTSYLR